MRTLARLLCAMTFAIALVASPSARAETFAERNRALKLAGEALDLFKAGDHASALAKFSEADSVVPAPTLKVRIAKCLDALGRMQEGAARYREVIALELKPWSPRVHREARDQAVEELARLLERTPKLTVVLSGSAEARAEVRIDGKLLEGPVGQATPFDPGLHVIAVKSGDRVVERSVTLERGRAERVTIDLPPPRVDAKPAGTSGEPNGTRRVLGFTLVGVGGAGLVVGLVGTGLLFGDRSELDRLCPDGVCYRDDPTAVDVATRYNGERYVSGVGLIAGGVVGAAGAAMLLVDALGRGADGPATSALVPVLAPGYFGISGRF